MEERSWPRPWTVHGAGAGTDAQRDDFQTVADIFKQLGDGSRIRIFWLLCHL